MRARGIAGRHERREEDEDPIVAIDYDYLNLDGTEDDDDDSDSDSDSSMEASRNTDEHRSPTRANKLEGSWRRRRNDTKQTAHLGCEGCENWNVCGNLSWRKSGE